MEGGKTVAEAVAASDRIIREWLEGNAERVFPVPEPCFYASRRSDEERL